MPQNVSLPDTYAVGDHDEQSTIPITSRFLFVDVAAQRAKQLRRGALPRLDRHAVGPHAPQARARGDGGGPDGADQLLAADARRRQRASPRHDRELPAGTSPSSVA